MYVWNREGACNNNEEDGDFGNIWVMLYVRGGYVLGLMLCKLFFFLFSFPLMFLSRVSFDGDCLGVAMLLREAVETFEWC